MNKLVVGLVGPIGAGKDSVGLAAEGLFDAKMLAWATELYRQVSIAFNVPVQALQERKTKEAVNESLALINCDDMDFVNLLVGQYGYSLHEPLSPRDVLRKWGTEYRRAQDQNYWVNISKAEINETDTEIVLMTGTRFDNEIALVYEMGGFLLHVNKPGVEQVKDHASEKEIPFMEGVDHRINNNGTLEDLALAVSDLFRSLGHEIKTRPTRRIA